MNNLPPEVTDLINKIVLVLIGSGAMAGVGRWILSKILDKLERIPEKEWFDHVNRKLDEMPDKNWQDWASSQLSNIPSKSTLDAVLVSFASNSSSISSLQSLGDTNSSRITDAHRRIGDMRNKITDLTDRIDKLEAKLTEIESRQDPSKYNVIQMPPKEQA